VLKTKQTKQNNNEQTTMNVREQIEINKTKKTEQQQTIDENSQRKLFRRGYLFRNNSLSTNGKVININTNINIRIDTTTH
jgi:hypothetical protein